MPQINQLNTLDNPNDSDLLPIYSQQNGDARKVSVGNLRKAIESGNAKAEGFVTQYSFPTGSGFTTLVVSSKENIWLILRPTAPFDAGTIKLPPQSDLFDGQRFIVNTTEEILNLTIDGNGANLSGQPVTISKDGSFELRYDAGSNIWYRVSGTDSSALAVIYTPAGIGAVATTVQAKLRESVSVKDFGAVGNGVTDDTAAVQAAAATGIPLRFPAGVYLLKSAITFPDAAASLSGEGMSASLLRWTAAAGSTGLVFTNTSSRDKTTITGLTLLTEQAGVGSAIKCTRTGEAAAGTVQTRTDVRLTIRDVEIKGATSTTTNGWRRGVECIDVMHAVFSGVHVTGYNAGTPATPPSISCFSLRGNNNPTEYSFTGCWGFSAVYGIEVAEAVEGVHVSNSNFVNVNFGISWISSSLDPLLSFVGSHVNAHNANIRLVGVSQSVISNNLFYKREDSVSNGSGVNLENCAYPILNSNIFQNNSAFNYDCIVCASGTSGALIYGNIFQRFTTGIWLQSGSSNCEVFANKKISGSGTLLFDQSTSNVKPTGSYVYLLKATTQAITNSTHTVLSWETEANDDIAALKGATDNTRITIPDGVSFIDIEAAAVWADNNTGQRRLEVLKNGAPTAGLSKDIRTASSNSNHSISALMVPVTAGDYFQVRVFQSSGGDLNVLNDTGTYFKIRVNRRDR